MDRSQQAASMKKTLLVYSVQTFLQGVVIGIGAVLVSWLFMKGNLFSSYNLLIVVIVGLGTVIAGFVNFSSYAKPFMEIETFIGRIADGDLSHEINVENLNSLKRFGLPMNRMKDSLNQLVSDIKGSTILLEESVETLSETLIQTIDDYQSIKNNIDEVTIGLQMQSNAADESAKSMDEMAQGVNKIAESTAIVSETSHHASELSSQGQKDMKEVSENMMDMHKAVGELADIINDFENRSKEIGEIVQVISEISGQTNLLALNASIEAARAGEHGKGFAVVADEVGKLAKQSNQSASEIASLIQGIQDKAKDASSAMKQTVGKVTSGKGVVEKTAQSFEQIISSIQDMDGQIQEISAVSEEMAAGSEQIASRVEEVAKIATASTKNISDISERGAHQSEMLGDLHGITSKLQNLAQVLTERMSIFKL